MFEDLLDDDPYIQEREERAAAESAVQAWQKAALTVVKNRFPSLTDVAQQTIPIISQVDVLEFLTAKISGAPDEQFVRTLLDMSAA